MSKKILVTGGAGYIGSFIVRGLKDSGFEPFIVDNLSSGHKTSVSEFPVINIDLVADKAKLLKLFKKEKFIGVIHMASFIQMGESFRDPSKYFNNNLISAINLLDVMVASGTKFIVFSSSAGVYGNPDRLPIKEDFPKNPLNPYGETKLMIEKILHWYDLAYGLKFVAIRYFNAAGASLDGSIGEDHPNESHLIPLILKSAIEGNSFTVFGDDYKTSDGSCVRDYVHVLDLASAHTKALGNLITGVHSNYYNAGAGRGYSNFEIIETIKKVTNLPIEIKIGQRREGDADSLYASIDKIKKDLDWEPKYAIEEIVKSAYLWHKTHPEGYK